MGMTQEPIPLPWSDCLLEKSELRTVTPTNYEDGGALRRAVKVNSLPNLIFIEAELELNWYL